LQMQKCKSEMAIRYEYDASWVTEAVRRLKQQPGEAEQGEDTSFYEWILICKVKQMDENTQWVKREHMKWQLQVNRKLQPSAKFKPIIELQRSTVEVEGNTGLMGMFAAIRFEKGDIITVQKADEEVNFEKPTPSSLMTNNLYFGGGWALDAANIRGKNNNAIPNGEGVVRAMQRIQRGQEIFIDYKPLIWHPVQYLEAIVENKGGNEGKVISFSPDDEGVIQYNIKFSGGEELKLSEKECDFPNRGRLETRTGKNTYVDIKFVVR
jgi:hypothetical protein